MFEVQMCEHPLVISNPESNFPIRLPSFGLNDCGSMYEVAPDVGTPLIPIVFVSSRGWALRVIGANVLAAWQARKAINGHRACRSDPPTGSRAHDCAVSVGPWFLQKCRFL